MDLYKYNLVVAIIGFNLRVVLRVCVTCTDFVSASMLAKMRDTGLAHLVQCTNQHMRSGGP